MGPRAFMWPKPAHACPLAMTSQEGMVVNVGLLSSGRLRQGGGMDLKPTGAVQ